ncbi:outer membrane protein assembly factor BamB family protein [Actinoplanes sp. RD1]|uniref:outer membrane protein assembly factor BamB family protein n=1 Tax=Actinoplanes sp. RD1 TaxID=3064538 RepID=UPI002741F075|nr:PQQ-binding-like beta-propeller repeat protein [Actinoplanes sp. RD1]
MQLTRCALVAALIMPAPAPAPAAADTHAGTAAAGTWSQDGYGAGHTFYNPGESVINSSTVRQLRTRWTVTPRAAADSCPLAPVAPLVAGDRMIVLEPAGNQVAAYDARTGRRLWSSSIGQLEATALAVSGDTVIVSDVACSSQSSDDSNVIALDSATGVLRWDSLWAYTTDQFVVSGGTVVTSGHCDLCAGDDAHQVAGWRVADGRLLWSRSGVVLAGPVATRDGLVLTSATARELTSVAEAASGRVRWSTGIRYEASAADPVRPQVYVTGKAGLRALDRARGRTLWTVRGETGELATDGRRVFVASAGRVNAYDTARGRLLWTRALRTPSHPVRAGGLLYVTSGRALLVLAPTTGATVRSFGSATDHVVVAGGRLLVTNGRTVKAFTPAG